MDKRVLLTTVVCLGILVFWQTFVAPPPKAQHPAPQASSGPQAKALQTTAPQTAASLASLPVPTASTDVPTRLPPPVASKEQLVTFDQPLFTAEISTRGAALRRFTLKDYKEGGTKRGDQKHPVSLVSVLDDEPRPTAVLSINGMPFAFSSIAREGDVVALRGEQAGLKGSATWHAEAQDYLLRLSGTVENTTSQPQTVNAALAVNGVFNEAAAKKRTMFEPPPEQLTPLYDVGGDVYRHAQGKKDPPLKPGPILWAGIDRQYFLFAVAPKAPAATDAIFVESHESERPQYLELSTVLSHAQRVLGPGDKIAFDYLIYAGPKAQGLLKAPGLGFEDAVDYKVMGLSLSFLARPMLWVLNRAYDLVKSYGLAIMILTLVVKLLMLPVTQKAAMSMQVMKELKPELDKIKERFPKDRERQGVETMRLYKERGANPFLSGCLPALLQMPVYFALWRMLAAAVELYQQPFLWLGDLTAKDPYYILPVALGITMFLQQRLTPPMGDPQQQKMMMFIMPPMMTVFMINLPSGLVFYIFVNNILTIVQQAYISRKFSKPATA